MTNVKITGDKLFRYHISLRWRECTHTLPLLYSSPKFITPVMRKHRSKPGSETGYKMPNACRANKEAPGNRRSSEGAEASG